MKGYISSLKDLKEAFEAEGIGEDEPIYFATNPINLFVFASVYKGEDGKVWVDLEEEGEDV